MTEEEFYELSYEDMVDCLLRLKAKYKLNAISKQKILDLAEMFSRGYKVNSLRAYIFAIQKREQVQIDYDTKIWYHKNRDWVEEWHKENDWLWDATQKIIDEHKKKGGGSDDLVAGGELETNERKQET